MTDQIRAWCLVKGKWVEREDPVMAACDPSGGDVHAAMTSLGFEPWCQLGYDVPVGPVIMALYSREAPPLQFLLQLEGNAGNVVEHVFAETLPDAMELLAKWSPIAGSTEAARSRDTIGFDESPAARLVEPTAPVAGGESPRSDPAAV